MRHNDHPILGRNLRAERLSNRKLRSPRVLEYDVHAHKLARVSIALRLLRMAPQNTSRSLIN
jgi:hypothetical protein